jgi:hypothetical protein
LRTEALSNHKSLNSKITCKTVLTQTHNKDILPSLIEKFTAGYRNNLERDYILYLNFLSGFKMNKKDERTVPTNSVNKESASEKEFGYSTTAKVPRKTFVGELPIKQPASLLILLGSDTKRVIQLEERDIIIGRGPECDLPLSLDNVSREHARVYFRNDEYYIEDLGSTNGTYVNGIRIVKCALRKNDQIDIGGVKIFFNE